MPSRLKPRLRTALAVLAAFAAGVGLTLAYGEFRPISLHGGTYFRLVPTTAGVPDARAPAPATSAAPANAMDADDPGATLDAWPADAPTPEQVIVAQPEAMRTAAAGLAPRTPGKPNLYVLAFAADASEDTFRNEAEYLRTLVTRRFGAPGHALVLENHPSTLGTRPLASWTNLEAGLDALARVMDPREDILMVYVATHGSRDHTLLVDMDPIPLDQLDPDGLADILSRHAFRWKVLVVNACYSGGFVPKLRGAGTLVLTSAREDRTSFGCGADSDITYFGRAWLANALNTTPDFIEAFNKARGEIAGWERKDGVEPSEPQIDVGAGIAGKLAAWRQGASIGPVVPFAPAAR